jgi:hypothetical protein
MALNFSIIQATRNGAWVSLENVKAKEKASSGCSPNKQKKFKQTLSAKELMQLFLGIGKAY